MAGFTNSVNTFNTNKFLFNFNLWPNLTGKKLEPYVYNNNVKSITIPNLSIPHLNTVYGHERQLHPNPIGFRNLNTLLIEFKIDDKMLNYYGAYSWIMGSRTGENIRTDLKGNPLLRDNCMDSFQIKMLDNADEPTSIMTFYRCFLTDLGNLQLQYGSSEVGTFTCTFEYERMELETFYTEENK